MRRVLLSAIGALLLFSGLAVAETITVRPRAGTPLLDAFEAAQDGDVIVITRGVYRERVTMSNRSNITITAKGRVIIDGDDRDDGEDVMSFVNVDGLSISKLVVRNSSDDGIETIGCANVLITKCSFADCGDSGIEDTQSQGIVIEKNKFTRVSWGCAISYRDVVGSTGIRIARNKMTRVSSVGIEVSGDDAVIERNSIKRLTGLGIAIDPARASQRATIERNSISSVRSGSDDGIRLNGAGHTVLKNKIKSTSDHGIDVSGDGGNTLEGNKITRAGRSGSYLASSGNDLVKNKAAGSRDFDLESVVLESANTFDGNSFRKTDFLMP